ncbi:restriction endonuclease subunit S [Pontibacter sp. BT310]|uniref:Restriction endonuclease subunit S n=1 Tax=Pontibacter populi TaxID=890055 RepID=A0ABS6XAC5_9BACT|nr:MULTISPECIES: restriction endonuclease subunit S [Pontibacter]MBJ6118092.1 restriction endonuclease subunit S [Pontibacter sp. BT310]MBR0570519.1 restriction endonuclease subunit S [Microvirga sp. STS03]MBW3364945.1 restriction endonuclease subunit S [Pontibacter populi]
MEATAEITAAVKSVPALRFPEFEGEWQSKKIGELCKVKHGFAFKGEYFSDNGPYIVLTPGNFNPEGGFRYQGEKEKYYVSDDFPKDYILEEGDLLTVMTEQAVGLIGSALIVPKSGLFLHNQRLGLFQVNQDVERKFLAYYMATEYLRTEFSRTAAGTKVRHTSPQKIEGISVQIPSLDEQKIISDFLSSVTDKIQQLSKKKELLEKYKKGAMQQIFSQQIRFKDDNGSDFPEWEDKKLVEVAKRVTQKNKSNDVNFVLTNSATQGIVSQQEYFDKDIANQENLEGYYVVDVDDFIYNPRISATAPVGPIKRNKLVKGVMSPLYTVFRFENRNLEFLEFFFETTAWHKYMKSIANYGARHDRMSITNEDFLKLPIPQPCKEEQKKITEFLTAVDNKLNYTSKQLEQAQQFKKGLLQQLFV